MPIRRPFRFLPSLFVALLLLACVLSPAIGAQGPEQFRDISGKVVDAHHQPVKGAIVKIENEDSQAIMSFITDADGFFHFKRVSSNDDFRVWATAGGASSKKRELSKFNSKENPFLTLEIP